MFLALVPLAAACWWLERRFRPAPLGESCSRLFVFATGTIVVCGYAASALGRLNDPLVWTASASAVLVAVIAIGVAFPASGRPAPPQIPREGPPSRFERMVLAPMAIVTAVTGLLNAAVLIFTAPRAWDGLTYHVARVAYYLQHRSMAFYDANYWAQVVHPRNSAVLSLHAYLVSGGNERVASIWQLLAYWTCVVVVYGIAIEIGSTRRQAAFTAMLFAVLTASLMQAAAADNDMILAAYAGITVYSLLRYRSDPRPRHLATASGASALALGTKAVFAVNAPLLVAAAIDGLAHAPRPRSRAWLQLAAFGVAALLVFTVPSGYVTMFRLFGNALGPASVRTEHTFEGYDAATAVRYGAKNVLRFGVDFLSLDGLPRVTIVNRAQRLLRAVPAHIIPRLGVDLEEPGGARTTFLYDRIASAHEVHSYWGVLGFTLVWASVMAAAFGRRVRSGARLLAWMTIGFLVLQAFSSLYDPWRGRYFITAAIFAAPVAGRWLAAKHPLARAYLVLVIWIGCVSAITAVVFHSNGVLVSVDYGGAHPSLFRLDRTGQMMANRTSYEDAVRRFDAIVPADAVVAVLLEPASFEYPLFGRGLTRRLIPINSFRSGRQPVPSDAEYLVFGSGLEPPRSGDVHLGSDWYLRPLKR